MSISLLDVNVLVALLDPLHLHHDDAHRWLGFNRKHGWATCPLTINGCIRVLSNPSYPTVTATPVEVAGRLEEFCTTPHHHFWPDSVTLTDSALFKWPFIRSHRQLTDVYLLALAVHNHGCLATFDRAIPLKAVEGAESRHLVFPTAD